MAALLYNSFLSCIHNWHCHGRASFCFRTRKFKRVLGFELFNSLASTQQASAILPPSSHTQYSRLLPYPSQWNRFPRIEHLVVSEDGNVLEYICKALDLPPPYVMDLIRFGAVYCAYVCPPPPLTATEEQIKLYRKVTEPSVLKKRRLLGRMSIRRAQKIFRISDHEEYVEAGTYLRVHVHPKRFPRCYEIDWKSRILDINEDYVVLDKPAGVSVGGTTDNVEECCTTFASYALGIGTKLKTTHQIDNCTEGCVVMARTDEYASSFHIKIREKKVRKLYLALAVAPVPVGIITHYMRPFRFAPRLVSEVGFKGWHKCQLQVLECKKVLWPDAIKQAKIGVEDGGWPVKDHAYECQISLLTGRTHQIRAQLAACGAPVVGDTMYMPAAIAEMENAMINPFGKWKKPVESCIDGDEGVREWVWVHGNEPSVAIGLQACQIEWDDGRLIYNAGAPWWR